MRVWFDDKFWPTYPRKEGKTAALKAAKLKAKTPEMRTAIIEGLKRQLPTLQSRQWKFIPLPATWLNGERWTDEIPAAGGGYSELPELTASGGGYPEWKGMQ